jgi:hypothetical protein
VPAVVGVPIKRLELLMLIPGGNEPDSRVVVPTPIAKISIDLFIGISTYAVKVSAVISGADGGEIWKVIVTVWL